MDEQQYTYNGDGDSNCRWLQVAFGVLLLTMGIASVMWILYSLWCTPLSRQFETEIKIKFCAYTRGGSPGWWKPNALCSPPQYTAAGVW
jgi:hypothetical protein